MSVPMIDSAFAPNDAQLQCFYAKGVRVYGGYLGGLHVYQAGFKTWAANNFEAFRRARDAGFSLIGYWVGDQRANGDPFGYQRGRDAGRAAYAAALEAGALMVVALDVEDNAAGADVEDYCHGFADAILTRALYGNPATMAYGHYFDATIDASYPDVPPTNPKVAPRNAWQYQGGHLECGLNVDRGVADEWFLTNNATEGDVPMDQNQLASWMAQTEYRLAEMAGALAHNRAIQGSTLYVDATDPGNFATQRDAMKADPETAGSSIFSAISGTDKSGTYPLPVGQPGPQGPPGPAGGVHHHNFGVTVTGPTSDPI